MPKKKVAKSKQFDCLTVKFWHGGEFELGKNGELEYNGGECTNFVIDPDELCYWEFLEFRKQSGMDWVNQLFYQIPGMNMDKGLRVFHGDEECRVMSELGVKNRGIVVYDVQHNYDSIHADIPPSKSQEVGVSQPVPKESDVSKSTNPKQQKKQSKYEAQGRGRGTGRGGAGSGSQSAEIAVAGQGRGRARGRGVAEKRAESGEALVPGQGRGMTRGKRRAKIPIGIGVLFGDDGNPVVPATKAR
uniref:PB1-like domain-containing protein n=1 Tax=Chenopodium quinoa TaxID=63459 RepID=A0A803LM35_CHEQI